MLVDGGVLELGLAADGVEVLDVDLDISAGMGALVALVLAASTALCAGVEAQTLKGFVEATDASCEAVVGAQEPVEPVETGGAFAALLVGFGLGSGNAINERVFGFGELVPIKIKEIRINLDCNQDCLFCNTDKNAENVILDKESAMKNIR